MLFDSFENWKPRSNVALTCIGGLDNTLPCVSECTQLLVITEGSRRRLFLSKIRYLFSVEHLIAVSVIPQLCTILYIYTNITAFSPWYIWLWEFQIVTPGCRWTFPARSNQSFFNALLLFLVLLQFTLSSVKVCDLVISLYFHGWTGVLSNGCLMKLDGELRTMTV